jgi:tryptophan synthase alpha chain
MGKERLAKVFAQKNKDILSIYLSAGYPKLDAMPKLADVLAKNKVDFIEAGMPYSDPLADGPTIQKSSSIALKNGMNLDLYFDQIKQIRQQSDIPIIFMGYFNQVLKTGVDIFLQKCVESGIDGLIIPDLTPEIYQASYQAMFEKSDLAMIFLVTPTTSTERIKLIDQLSSGFIYVVSSSSTTGNTKGFGEKEEDYFKQIRSLNLNNPSVIGFGIDSPEKFALANQFASGAIIGSAFIKVLQTDDYLKAASDFIKLMKGHHN